MKCLRYSSIIVIFLPIIENTLAIFILLINILHKVESTGDPPQFINPSSPTTETVTEDADTSTYIFIVVAIDNEGNALTYSVHSQIPSSPSFTFDPASRKLYPPAGLDAETTTSFAIKFSVTDGTSTEDSPVLTVNIQDVNEHSPDFNQTSYIASIYDTASNGDVILTVFATDLDVTSSLSYSITGGDSTTFSIGSSSGAVSVATASNLNAASTPSYTLTVQVSDTSTTDTASVIITVLVSDDPCTPNPCKNSGSCSRSGTSYTCTCQTGWIGTTCSTGTDVSLATLVGAVISAFVVGFLFGVFLRHFYQRLKRTVTGHNTQDQRQQIQLQETDINVVNLPTNTYEQLRNRTVTESRMTYDSLNDYHNMRI